jgi:hypothetical protein
MKEIRVPDLFTLDSLLRELEVMRPKHNGIIYDSDSDMACGAASSESSFEAHLLQHDTASADQYGVDACAGTWPYYGRTSMSGPDAPLSFFSLIDGRREHPLPDEFDRMKRLHQVTKSSHSS